MFTCGISSRTQPSDDYTRCAEYIHAVFSELMTWRLPQDQATYSLQWTAESALFMWRNILVYVVCCIRCTVVLVAFLIVFF